MANEFSEFLGGVVRNATTLLDKKAKGYAQSTRVRKSIKTAHQQKGRASYVIRSIAQGQLAVFREFGTHPHTIVPRNHPVLVFPWDKAADFIPRTSDGRVILKKVSHPGSEADNNNQGYMRPAGRETVAYIKREVLGKGKVAIRAELIAGFKQR